MPRGKLSRRKALTLGAATAALPLVHIRTAGAAGKLTIGFWDHWVPVGNEAMRKMVAKWADQTKTEVSIDFITSVGNKNLLTIAAEAQAKTGHDIQTFPTWEVLNNARNLEPMDDVAKRLTAKYGSFDPIVDYLARSDGRYHAIPTYVGSQNKPCCGRIDLFRQHVGMDLPARFPAAAGMGPDYDQWTWEAFLAAAEKCHKAGTPFGMPLGQFPDAIDWTGAVFRSFGATLVNEKGEVTVKSDQVTQVLEWFRKLCAVLPGDVYSWDDASNNRALISGKASLIMNPPSAWAVARKDNPQVAENLWTFPPPAGPAGRFVPYLPYFWGIWQFARNKSAAKDLLEWLMQREQAEVLISAVSGYDLPPFASMTDFPVWQNEGPPKGTIANYPLKPVHKDRASVAAFPAPPDIAVQIYNQATMTKMVARVAQSNEPIPRVIAWAAGELEGFAR
ncbi:Extracellular solute-binding protein [Rhodovastum atsumiense]|uniref:Extracellular solute-binding protein n=1 Tax=Rhodovastum atsumiense TaxID=504468 RepID=A0A5M6IS18_9PROT|nr:extracellular solute-binding protein [Rhodovastum atsumiense]KAA5611084.1 extracellular solute-binding protein [Rhodovastum atsumiense]CAH2599144.1 Extracellular solute-binding protein [Rhodovastum atsumiense]